MNFAIGGLSGIIAITVVQPIDMIKVQIQVRAERGGEKLNPFTIAKSLYQEKGIRIFYKGLDSSWLRQAVYTSTRLGVFYNLKDYMIKIKKRQPTMIENTCLSLFSGAVGALVGNPTDLALIRLQSDSSLPPAERNNYKNVFDALFRILKEEGVLTLWRGSFPTIARAMAMNFSLMVPFEEAKKQLKPYIKNDKKRTYCASVISGFCATILSLPFDNVKTKLQKMKKGPDGKLPYKGLIDCFAKTIKSQGIGSLWIGVNTYFFRVAPHAVISLIFNEMVRNMFAKAMQAKKNKEQPPTVVVKK